jgi:hypothetical protein
MTGWWTFSAIVAAALVVYSTGCTKETDDFEARVKATVNPDELQAWATNVIAKTSFRGSDSVVVNEADIPKSVGLIYKSDGDLGRVTVERSSAGDYVQLWYGGGFGHWGLIIGYPTLVLTNHDSCYCHPWTEGIYFWRCQ